MGVDLKLEAVNAKLTDSFSPPIHRYPPPFWGRRPGAGRMPRLVLVADYLEVVATASWNTLDAPS